MAQLHFSDDLVGQVQAALEANDPRCRDDGVASQYLAALIGFKLGNAQLPTERKRAIQEQLCAFIAEVVADVEGPQTDEAFGIWRPGDRD